MISRYLLAEFEVLLISWQAKALNLFLKQTVKRSIENTKDMDKLRIQMRVLDKFVFGISSFIQQSKSTIANTPCDEFWVKESKSRKVLLYIHGGAFVFKTPAIHNSFVARLVGRLDMYAVVPDYPLAPESPFPAAIDSCFAVYSDLLAQGYKAEDIVIAGDSAGGNIAVALLARAKRHGVAMPCCMFLLSPVTDMIQSGLSSVENRYTDVLFSLEAMLNFRKLYIQQDIDFHNDEISPLFSDFEGFPPCQVHVSSSELMRDDGARLVEYMKLKGVKAKLQMWHNMPHVFPIFEQLPESKKALSQISEFVEKHY